MVMKQESILYTFQHLTLLLLRHLYYFSFHGGGGDSRMMLGTNDMRPIADTANFIAVYPSGSGGAWMHKAPTNYNDIYFIEAIIDTLSSQFNIDNDRVYACGYSEGEFLVMNLPVV